MKEHFPKIMLLRQTWQEEHREKGEKAKRGLQSKQVNFILEISALSVTDKGQQVPGQGLWVVRGQTEVILAMATESRSASASLLLA